MFKSKLVSICILFLLMLVGCQSPLMKTIQPNEFNEQLYINAKLSFAIKHPLDWVITTTPVSSPNYRNDTVIWKVKNPNIKTDIVGTMLIKSNPTIKSTDLADILSSFLSNQPELTSGQAINFTHSAGNALKLVGHDIEQGRLTIALQGQLHDFIISLDYPNDKFNKLLPVFNDIVASFTEIVSAEPATKHDAK